MEILGWPISCVGLSSDGGAEKGGSGKNAKEGVKTTPLRGLGRGNPPVVAPVVGREER